MNRLFAVGRGWCFGMIFRCNALGGPPSSIAKAAQISILVATRTIITDDVKSLDDLALAIELYHTLIDLGRYEDAFVLFRDRLDYATQFRLGSYRQRLTMLLRLWPDGDPTANDGDAEPSPPRLKSPRDQSYALNAMALSYDQSGQPGKAVRLLQFASVIDRREKNQAGLEVRLSNLPDSMSRSGRLHEAEANARDALSLSRALKDQFGEGVGLRKLGLILATRGYNDSGDLALQRAQAIMKKRAHAQSEGVALANMAETGLSRGNAGTALPIANRVWELAGVARVEVDFIRAARLQGRAAILAEPADLPMADERLTEALTRARACNFVDDELSTLIALAQLHILRGNPNHARELLEDVWEPADIGPYPRFAAEAFNLLAAIEQTADNTSAAIDAACKAYERAWADGPPFAYHYPLEKAKSLLTELGVPESDWPDMELFDASMPDVEIDPPAEAEMDEEEEADED